MKALRNLALIAVLGLAACGHKAEPETTIVVNTRPPIEAQKIDPLVLAPVKWKVLNNDAIKQLAASNENIVLFALDEDNFKALGTNLDDIKAYLKSQKTVIEGVVAAANVDQTKTTTEKPKEK